MSFERVEEPDDLHEFRYVWASRYITKEDVVLDAACGTGYGRRYLSGHYIGVDKNPTGTNIGADLRTWVPPMPFDVFVGLETIEHLDDYSNFVRIAKGARKYIVISTPIVPTTGYNTFHVHDFQRTDIEDLFIGEEWELVEYEQQADVYGLWAFQRKGPQVRGRAMPEQSGLA